MHMRSPNRMNAAITDEEAIGRGAAGIDGGMCKDSAGSGKRSAEAEAYADIGKRGTATLHAQPRVGEPRSPASRVPRQLKPRHADITQGCL